MPTRPLCFFAHYDPANSVDPYVLRYLRTLSHVGFDIVFVTTSDLPETEVLTVRAICKDVIRRENRGLDFGSWALAYSRYGHGFEGEILIANDSVYGPINDLGAMLDRLRRLPGELRGLVESRQHAPHLQSWFVLLSPAAHQSESFASVMGQDFAGMLKSEIVIRGEVALSTRLRSAGFRAAALFSQAHRAFGAAILDYNPTHTSWRSLIEDHGIGFIKVELLRDNTLRLPDLGHWRAIVAERDPELVGLIERHRVRLERPWAGDAARPGLPSPLSHQAFVYRDLAFERSGRRVAGFAHTALFATASSSRRLAAKLPAPIRRPLSKLRRGLQVFLTHRLPGA